MTELVFWKPKKIFELAAGFYIPFIDCHKILLESKEWHAILVICIMYMVDL